MKKPVSPRRKGAARPASQTPPASSPARKRSPAPIQSEWVFDELAAMGAMPRCEETGVNVDLHLVAYRDPDSNEITARILGADFRHLVRHKTTLSVPVAVLTMVSLRQLEKLRKIPLGTRAARQLREWLGRDTDAAWKEAGRSRQLRPVQESLDLPGDLDQPVFKLI